MKKYKEAYGKLPKRTPADAGYGSYDNYSYCKENNIELYMKYSGYYKEKEKAELLDDSESRNLQLWEEINEKKKRK